MRRAKRSQDGKPVLRWLGRTAVLALVISGTVAFTQFEDAPPTDPQVLAAQTSADVRAERDVTSRSGTRTELVSVAAAPVHLTVELDSGTLPVRTGSTTVAQVLTESQVVLDEGDVVSPGLTTRVHEDMVISVRTPETTVETVTETEDFESREVSDPELEKGTRVTQTEGRNGETSTTYFVRSVDGDVVERTQAARTQTAKVRDEVIQIGTMDPPEPTVEVSVPEVGGSGPEPATSGKILSPGEARTVARGMIADRGWGDGQFTCLNNLWNRESN